MVEVVQGLLNNGNYIMKILPADITIALKLTKHGNDCITWLKKVIFMSFPDLRLANSRCRNLYFYVIIIHF